MAEKIKISELPDFEPAEYLDNEEAIAEYLTAIIEENDPGLLAAALGDVAKARGMTDIAKASGLSREALYKALRPNAQPRFDTINRVCRALDVRLVATAARGVYYAGTSTITPPGSHRLSRPAQTPPNRLSCRAESPSGKSSTHSAESSIACGLVHVSESLGLILQRIQ